MKKSLIALAALAAVSAASAQSSVTLYGRLDVGQQNIETESNLGGVNTKEFTNGINDGGLSSNYWGLKGSEDLGGGLKANFQLESAIATNTGASSGFTRISTLGLSGNFGEVKIGRDYNPLYSVIGSADVFARTAATTFGLLPIGTRTSSMISYETPTFSGFSAKFMTGNNESGTSVDNGPGAVSNSTNSLSGTYANGPLMVAIGWGESKGASGDASVLGGADFEMAQGGKTDGSAISATYDFGVAKVFANYTQTNIRPVQAANFVLKGKETNLGVSVPMGAFTFLAAYGYNELDGSIEGEDFVNGDGNDYVLGVTYGLSKRTTLYAKAGTYNKISGNIIGVAADAKTTATAIGVRHTF